MSSSGPETRNLLSDSQHTENDKKVNDAIARQSGPANIYRVLNYLASFPENQIMDLRDMLANELDSNPTVIAVVQRSIEKKRFREVRNLVILQKPQSREDTVMAQSETTISAWSTKYSGDAWKTLHHTILSENQRRRQTSTSDAKPYANAMSIVQSSGTGKSRMVDELAKKVFTLPFLLRPDDEVNGAGVLTKPDAMVRDLVSRRLINSDGRVKAGVAYCAFFMALFDEVMRRLNKYTVPRTAPEKLAEWWRNYLHDHRSDLYKAAVDAQPNALEEIQLKAQVKAKEAMQVDGGGDQLSPQASHESTAAYDLARTRASNLQAQVDTITESRETLIVLYFDEAHTLHDSSSSTEMNASTRYHALCWALDALCNTTMFALFLSTRSNIFKFAPPTRFHPSARVTTTKIDDLPAPYPYLPFDCHPLLLDRIGSETVTLQQSQQVEFLCQFGRPLFWTRYNNGDPSVKRTIVDFALAKLVAGAGESSDKANLAVLDVRLLLTFSQTAEALEAQGALVERHMRSVHVVSSDRERVYSSYPSEPLLAEAAARQWAAPKDLIKTLSTHVANGMILRGERGEMVARLLVTLAFDAAVKTSDAGPGAQHTRAVPVLSFLRELFAEDVYNTIAGCTPVNGGKKLGEAFKDARVRFTHFARASDSSAVTTEAAYAAVLRSMAFQCSPGQEHIDMMIPVVYKPKSMLQESVMTGILISVKNRAHSIPRASALIDAAALEFFPESSQGDQGERPYIALQLELGVSSETLVIPETHRQRASIPREVKKQQSTHPRYMAIVRGCTSDVYKVVGSHDFRALLNARTMRADHPHDVDGTREAVAQGKPVFGQDNNSYGGWMELDAHSRLGGTQTQPTLAG